MVWPTQRGVARRRLASKSPFAPEGGVANGRVVGVVKQGRDRSPPIKAPSARAGDRLRLDLARTSSSCTSIAAPRCTSLLPAASRTQPGSCCPDRSAQVGEPNWGASPWMHHLRSFIREHYPGSTPCCNGTTWPWQQQQKEPLWLFIPWAGISWGERKERSQGPPRGSLSPS